MFVRARPYLGLVVLWALYFHPLLLNPTGTLYADDSDFLAEHLPAKLFLNREWRETGELPLWNPYHFCGTPFVHDIQVGCFYPPYAVTYLVPESVVGAALSWVIALHVLAAGVFAYLYARSHDLGELGSLIAAVGFMLSAKWMTHLLLAGHTITVGLAWLPLVLLGLERMGGSKNPSPGPCPEKGGGKEDGTLAPPSFSGKGVGGLGSSLLTGVALALLVLGTHPQWTFYAGVFAVAWTLPSERSRRTLLRWLIGGLGAVAVALLLCAVQLLPTLEAARYSTRTGGVEASGSLSLALPTFLGLIGPSLTYDPPRSWEVRGIFGACWLAAALAAPKLTSGRAKWHLGVFLGLVFFALGGAVLIEWLPGFGLFRVPGRMLLIAAFPLAFLAGVTIDALIRAKWDAAAWQVVRRYVGLVVSVAVLPAFLATALDWYKSPEREEWLPGSLGWATTGIGLVVVARLKAERVWTERVQALGVVLFAEVLLTAWLLPAVRPQAAIYPPSETVAFLAQHMKPGEARALDRDTDGMAPLGIGAPLAMTDRIETVRGYNPLDVRHYREFLGFVTDDPGPLKGNSPFTQQVIPNFEVANPELLNLMNVRYLVSPADEPPPPGPWRAVATDAGSPPVPPVKPGHRLRLPPYTIYENPAALPRAFVVPEAAVMPVGRELDALKACDFRRTVLLTTDGPLPPNGTAPFRAARVTAYRPNRVAVELDGRAGFLVLSDVWFPGWTCRIDGAEVPVYRANHAFRAVALPAGATTAVFAFEPRSYRIGWWVSAASFGVVLVGLVGCVKVALRP